jgi:hypothetical protein
MCSCSSSETCQLICDMPILLLPLHISFSHLVSELFSSCSYLYRNVNVIIITVLFLIDFLHAPQRAYTLHLLFLGLFEGDEYSTLMTQCKEGAQREGHMLDSTDELYKWFTTQVMKNLHVVFTMNPSEDGLKDKAATSPALFNRCVLNWFGDWGLSALYQVTRVMLLQRLFNQTVHNFTHIIHRSVANSP